MIELQSPPPCEVLWVITRNDGERGEAFAQTAWKAVESLRWAFQECGKFEYITVSKRNSETVLKGERESV